MNHTIPSHLEAAVVRALHFYGYCDYPAAWSIQRTTPLPHHPKCSAVPGHHPMAGPQFLCDCGAVEAEFKRLLKAYRP